MVFLGLSVLDLGPTYVTDKTDVRQKHHLMPPPIRGAGIIIADNRMYFHGSDLRKASGLKFSRAWEKSYVTCIIYKC